jgi:hypothetical protein
LSKTSIPICKILFFFVKSFTLHKSGIKVFGKADGDVGVGHLGVLLPLDRGPSREAVVDVDVAREEVEWDCYHEHLNCQNHMPITLFVK